LQDAVPLSLEQYYSEYPIQSGDAVEVVRTSMRCLCNLANGGNAVGTGLNAPKDFDQKDGNHTGRAINGFQLSELVELKLAPVEEIIEPKFYNIAVIYIAVCFVVVDPIIYSASLSLNCLKCQSKCQISV
jgi:aspartate ammonia-lyase